MYKLNKEKNKILFLNKTSKYSYEGDVDLVLSPEFYWVRIFDIPIESKKEVLKVVPTFFEDFLDIEKYKFYTIKQDDGKYLCFAYDENNITQAIESANLSLNQISKIYFAQNEFSELDSFKILDEYFSYQDDILVKFPKEFVSDDSFKSCDISTLTLSKHKISVNKTNKYIDNKSLYVLSSILIVVSLLNFTKSFMISNTTKSIEQNKMAIKKEYNMLPTIMQTKSVVKTLENIQSSQVKLRDELNNLFSKNNKKELKKVYFRNGKVGYE